MERSHPKQKGEGNVINDLQFQDALAMNRYLGFGFTFSPIERIEKYLNLLLLNDVQCYCTLLFCYCCCCCCCYCLGAAQLVIELVVYVMFRV